MDFGGITPEDSGVLGNRKVIVARDDDEGKSGDRNLEMSNHEGDYDGWKCELDTDRDMTESFILSQMKDKCKKGEDKQEPKEDSSRHYDKSIFEIVKNLSKRRMEQEEEIVKYRRQNHEHREQIKELMQSNYEMRQELQDAHINIDSNKLLHEYVKEKMENHDMSGSAHEFLKDIVEKYEKNILKLNNYKKDNDILLRYCRDQEHILHQLKTENEGLVSNQISDLEELETIKNENLFLANENKRMNMELNLSSSLINKDFLELRISYDDLIKKFEDLMIEKNQLFENVQSLELDLNEVTSRSRDLMENQTDFENRIQIETRRTEDLTMELEEQKRNMEHVISENNNKDHELRRAKLEMDIICKNNADLLHKIDSITKAFKDTISNKNLQIGSLRDDLKTLERKNRDLTDSIKNLKIILNNDEVSSLDKNTRKSDVFINTQYSDRLLHNNSPISAVDVSFKTSPVQATSAGRQTDPKESTDERKYVSEEISELRHMINNNELFLSALNNEKSQNPLDNVINIMKMEDKVFKKTIEELKKTIPITSSTEKEVIKEQTSY